ncbi:MAG TPA: hypothetical protein DCK76_03835 [Desulfotomaculum sp.]|nr:MAG: Uncharacterized protein XD84_0707 [Desulfotomaculum sp. 46_80]HAG10517.1 hypothetical protein [Desulfotomaculum sp.]HBY04060.1 hypothetical protein [Desulfotomaculum sp.]
MRRLTAAAIVLLLLFLTFAFREAQKRQTLAAAYSDAPSLFVLIMAAASRGEFGSGDFRGNPNKLDLSLLEPGDILLGGNHGSSYGVFTHAGLYTGDNRVVDAGASSGVYLAEAQDYHDYDWAAILRVKADPGQKKAAVDYALSQTGRPFFILAPRKEDGLWYCTKLIWYSYLHQGINLDCSKGYWILPDSLLKSPLINVICYSGE